MSIEFSTTEFEFAHGKKPRGQGQWAFFFDEEREPMWFNGSFSQARQFAMAWAVTKGHVRVRVGS